MSIGPDLESQLKFRFGMFGTVDTCSILRTLDCNTKPMFAFQYFNKILNEQYGNSVKNYLESSMQFIWKPDQIYKITLWSTIPHI